MFLTTRYVHWYGYNAVVQFSENIYILILCKVVYTA